MMIWQQLGRRASPLMWGSAAAISLILLSIVLSQVDWHLFTEILQQTLAVFVITSVVLFLLEGVFTSLRFYVLTPNDPRLSSCFQLTAWYVVLLILLPLRLGEVAVIFLMKKHLNQNTSPAIMNVLVQRLFDVMTLCVIFLICILMFSSIFESKEITVIAAACLLALALILTILDKILAFLISPLLERKNSQNSILTKLLRALLQARIWYRHRLTLSKTLIALLLSLGKWLCNILGFVFLLEALQLPVDFTNSVVIAAAYNFLAIIPLQTIGGIGLSEMGLSGLLIFSGLSLSLAASSAILVRVVIIIIPFLFWALVMLASLPRKAKAHE